MIILHFTGQGKGFMQGVSEYIMLLESEEDLMTGDYKTVEEAIQAQTAPGFQLDKKYDTETDTVFTSLPMGRSLAAIMG